jgi:hypothetical protein
MRTTGTKHARYLGVDLTDGHARRVRRVDVCGLDPEDGALVARFWQWTYEGGISDVTSLLPEIRAARGALLDGPQALARRSATMRAGERTLAAAGKTPDAPPLSGPYAGFVRTSVELFAALDRAGIPVSPPDLVGATSEQYPGGSWKRLAGRLPSKKLPSGLAARRTLLEALGVRFPAVLRLNDDHLDACLGAVTAAAADGSLDGAHAERFGLPLERDGSVLREGPIVVLMVDPTLRAKLVERLAAAAR